MKKKLSKQVTIGVDPYTGKRIRKRIYADTTTGLRQAENNLRQELAEADNPSSIKFGRYAEDWFTAYKSTREKKTIEMYRSALNKMKPLYQRKLNSIRAMDLQLLINQHADHPNACQKLELALTQIFKRAVRDGIIGRSPAEDLTVPEMEQSEQRALTAQEIKAIKKAPLEPMERMFVEILYYFGLRPQEAFSLMPQDFDFQNKELKIVRAVGYDVEDPYIKTTKTLKRRKLPIPDVFIPEAKSYIRQIKKEKSIYLLHQDGQLMTHKQKSEFWTEIKAKINIQLKGNEFIDMTNGLRPYTFRHNFCCDCYYKGITVVKTAELMGNSPQMVMKVYTHLDNSKEPLEELKKRVL